MIQEPEPTEDDPEDRIPREWLPACRESRTLSISQISLLFFPLFPSFLPSFLSLSFYLSPPLSFLIHRSFLLTSLSLLPSFLPLPFSLSLLPFPSFLSSYLPLSPSPSSLTSYLSLSFSLSQSGYKTSVFLVMMSSQTAKTRETVVATRPPIIATRSELGSQSTAKPTNLPSSPRQWQRQAVMKELFRAPSLPNPPPSLQGH